MILNWIYKAMLFLAQAQTPVELNPAVKQVPPPVMPHQPGNILIIVLQVIYFLVCAGLIAAVMLQTTKSEGLSGMLGGATQSVFRGKKSVEEKIGLITSYLAGAFIVGSLVIFMLMKNLIK
ncbi:MAG: preprotein translocase subunit SecG [Candidatus Eremiobacteraeota bacterium]|nr:preprotein translocase subunit SecG [Candidatus Eremiobacteraeota bacterium]